MHCRRGQSSSFATSFCSPHANFAACCVSRPRWYSTTANAISAAPSRPRSTQRFAAWSVQMTGGRQLLTLGPLSG